MYGLKPVPFRLKPLPFSRTLQAEDSTFQAKARISKLKPAPFQAEPLAAFM
jgi:hypothetical protein